MSDAATSVVATTPAWLSFCGAMAPISSVILYMAPIPTVLAFSKKKKVGDLPLLPYTSMLSNAFVWVVYGIINSQPKLWTANSVGFVLSLYYFISFARFAPEGVGGLPGSLNQHIQGFVAIAASTLYFVKANKKVPIGNLGVLINMAMYASPLAAVKIVLAAKSSEAIPLPLTVASLLSCIFWTVTGYLDMKDPYVYAPTVVGIVFGLMQVSLKLVFKEQQSKSKLSPHLNSREVSLKKKR